MGFGLGPSLRIVYAFLPNHHDPSVPQRIEERTDTSSPAAIKRSGIAVG